MVRRLGITIVLACFLVLTLVPSTSADDQDFFVQPNKYIADFPEGSGSELFQLEIINACEELRTYSIEFWDYRVDVENPGDGSWIESVTPDTIPVPPDGRVLSNIQITIPEGTEDGKYTMYLKVTDEVRSVELPVTLVVRIGEAVPSYEFSMHPGIYRIDVTGEGPASKDLGLTVKNTGDIDSTYEIYPRLPDSPDKLDPDYTTGDLNWIEIPEDFFDVASKESGSTSFSLSIPEDVPNGLYKVWVGVKDINAEGLVQIQYACKLLINIDRLQKSTGVGSYGGVIFWAPPVGFLAVIGAVILYRRGNSRRQRKGYAIRG